MRTTALTYPDDRAEGGCNPSIVIAKNNHVMWQRELLGAPAGHLRLENLF